MVLYLAGLFTVWPWRVHQLGLVDSVTSVCVIILLQAAQGLAPRAENGEKDFLVVCFGLAVLVVLVTIAICVIGLGSGMLKKGRAASNGGKAALSQLPESLLQFYLDVSPSNVPDLKSVRDDCAQCARSILSIAIIEIKCSFFQIHWQLK